MGMTFFPTNEYSAEKCWHVHERTREYLNSTGVGDEIQRITFCFFPTWQLVPGTRDQVLSGHTFPWYESFHDLEISFTLTEFGLYKHAHSALRSALELGLLLVYWNMEENGHNAIKEWLRSRDSTPFASKVWKRISAHPNFESFQRSFDLESQFKSVSTLSDFVHTKGAKYSNFRPFPEGGTFWLPGQRFSESAFTAWHDAFTSTVRFLAVCYLVRYPLGTVKYDWGNKFGIDTPTFGGLEPNQVSRLEELVTPDIFCKISAIAENDSHVVRIMEWVRGLPDLSEENVEAQIIEQNKLLIQDMGLNEWLAFQKQAIQHAADAGQDTNHWKSRLANLCQWARNHGLDKPRP